MRFSDDLPHAQHSQGLDVLRALCALAVFFFHCNLVNFGWLGVQIFFVISGFLITRSLESRQEGTASQRMLAFYGRRARRILPPLYLYLLLLAPFAFLAQRELGSVEIQDSTGSLIVIQACDGSFCTDRRPVGEDGTALLGQANGPWA